MLPVPFRIIAHRGASGYAPENTMAAFRKALDMGVCEIETDVHFTSDGELILLHDHTLDRTTDGSGPPAAQSLAQLRCLDAGSWMGQEFAQERLITLDELLVAFQQRFTYHVELKDRTPGIGLATARIVQRHGREADVLVSGFDCGLELLAAKAAAPGLRSTVLVSPKLDTAGAIAEAAADGHDGISLYVDLITRDWVNAAHDAGLEVRCWGVRTPQDMERGANSGCNGMTINWPDWLQQWVTRS
jgi:glycerophosphoryl diester phosphodiesterase